MPEQPVDETLELTAPEDGQPVDQAVDGDVSETPEQVEEAAAPVEQTETAPVTPPAGRKWAGKYDRPEDLEVGFIHSQAEASRMAQELARLRGMTEARTQTTEQQPQYTPDQLENWKESYQLEMSEAQSAKLLAQQAGNFQEARRFDEVAKKAARQVNLIDRELRKLDVGQVREQNRAGQGAEFLGAKAIPLARTFQNELVPGSELYDTAAQFHQAYLAMGHKDSAQLQATAVVMAAASMGKLPATATANQPTAPAARREMTKNLNTALRQGVVTGSGKAAASKPAGLPDFSKMSDDEFIAYKRQRGWGD